jgi:hypothetical protein
MAKRGPKTQAGKATVSRNATKHGIRSEVPVVSGLEREAEWNAFRRGISGSLSPDGYLETLLVERIATLLWRLQRAVSYETAIIEIALQDIPDDMASSARYAEGALGIPMSQRMTQDVFDQYVGRRLIPDRDTLAKIMRYEAHLHRQYIQTLHELEAIQLRRQGGRSPLARLDISAPPVS